MKKIAVVLACLMAMSVLLVGCTQPSAEPTDPASTEPASTEPASTEPASTEPASTEPASTEPLTDPAVAGTALDLTTASFTVPAGWTAVPDGTGYTLSNTATPTAMLSVMEEDDTTGDFANLNEETVNTIPGMVEGMKISNFTKSQHEGKDFVAFDTELDVSGAISKGSMCFFKTGDKIVMVMGMAVTDADYGTLNTSAQELISSMQFK